MAVSTNTGPEELARTGGTEDGSVKVDVSYDIIRQMSAQLYANPRKAIEELICNSYDAGATECYVRLAKQSTERILVLDNGVSMDRDGLAALWSVARSPKRDHVDAGGYRTANGRLQIGKFGVGKLAAFAIGGRITHIAKMGDTVRLVSVGLDEIHDNHEDGPRFKVWKLTNSEAEKALAPLFLNLPSPWKKEKEDASRWGSWTAAIVDMLDEDVIANRLKPGFLPHMVEKALPIGADFQVWIDGAAVPLRTVDPANVRYQYDVVANDVANDIEQNLQAYWQQVLGLAKLEQVPFEKYKVTRGVQPGKLDECLMVPGLGPVWGSALFAWDSLTNEKRKDRGYDDHGFHVRVFGKLINAEDSLFGITQRTHSHWVRFRGEIEIPGLDKVLLVQRNAIDESTTEAHLTREVLLGIFNVGRREIDRQERDAEKISEERFGSRLLKYAPLNAAYAVAGMNNGKFPTQGLASLRTKFSTRGAANPIYAFDPSSSTIEINEEHPLVAATADGLSKVALRAMISEIAAGMQLGIGLLHESGVSPNQIGELEKFLDGSLRAAAHAIHNPLSDLSQELEDASHEGKKRFEEAAVQAFRAMRLPAERLGAADEPDGIVEIVRNGQPNLRVSFDAKGSNGIITHADLSAATLDRHRKEFDCDQSVAIAREYQTEGKGGKDSALLRETPHIPLLTVSGMQKMLALASRRPFTYPQLEKIVSTPVHPDDFSGFVEEVWKEFPAAGKVRLVIEVAHEKASKHTTDVANAGMIAGDDRIISAKITGKEIEAILQTAHLTGLIAIGDLTRMTFRVLGPVASILEALQQGTPKSPG